MNLEQTKIDKPTATDKLTLPEYLRWLSKCIDATTSKELLRRAKEADELIAKAGSPPAKPAEVPLVIYGQGEYQRKVYGGKQ